MEKRVVPVILAGGQGTRLWPLSRATRPKQFLALTGATSLFQQALLRTADAARYEPPVVVTNAEYRFIVAEQAAEIGIALGGILLEPQARNTALAIATAALSAQARHGPDCKLLVLPSDHDVDAGPDYWSAMDRAIAAACDGNLITFGIIPTYPETGFGYIRSDALIGETARPVSDFIEKPDTERARQMLAQGGHLWNTGMFAFRADAYLAECAALASDTLAAAEAAVSTAIIDLDFIRLGAEAFAGAPDISVDYAIFERTGKAMVVAVDFRWSDLGTWNAVWKSGTPDATGNVTRGAVTLEGVSRSLVVTDHAHIAVSGVEDIAVIATNDAIYVGRLSAAASVGETVRRLRADRQTASLTETHKTVHRPWGGYTALLNGERFQVKRLFVKPGKQLSLQKHHHRSEHWIVVRGTAEVILDGAVKTLSENQSVYLPQGIVHRLSNPGRIDLELIEVQTGSYFGEDDIIRIEDEFGRAGPG